MGKMGKTRAEPKLWGKKPPRKKKKKTPRKCSAGGKTPPHIFKKPRGKKEATHLCGPHIKKSSRPKNCSAGRAPRAGGKKHDISFLLLPPQDTRRREKKIPPPPISKRGGAPHKIKINTPLPTQQEGAEISFPPP